MDRRDSDAPIPADDWSDESAEISRETWGDDSDAPEPTGDIAPNLPAEPGDDEPDPSTADAGDVSFDAVTDKPVANVVMVKYQTAGKLHPFDGGDTIYRPGEAVTVEAEHGVRTATVALPSQRRTVSQRLRRVLGRAPASARVGGPPHPELDRTALARAKARARTMSLEVKVFRVEHTEDKKRAQVYFSADKRLEVRPLARALGDELGVKVELRQTGVRDEAKLVGGIGSCGQELCCTTWLPAFVPVSIKHAKDQGLVLNPTKVAGQCGRLKCCLVYEQSTYAEMRKGLPKLGKRVVTEFGEGRVVEVDVLRQRIRVRHIGGDVKVMGKDDVKPLFPSQKPNPPGAKSGKSKSRAKQTRRGEDGGGDPAS